MEWLEIIYKVLSGCILVMSIALLFVKSKTNKQKIKNAIEMTNEFLDILQAYMADADKFKNYNATEKHFYVATRIKDFARLNAIKIDDATIDELITKQAKFSKQVNYKEG